MNSLSTPKKLYRSQSQKMIGGVCAGVADYFAIDPIIVRVAWLLSSLINGFGIIAYLVFLVLVPQNPDETVVESRVAADKMPLYVGIALVFAGLIFLSNTVFDLFRFFHWPWLDFYLLDWELTWPVLLILFGAWFIWNGQRKHVDTAGQSDDKKEASPVKELRRSKTSKMVAGVCGGLADYWNIDVTIIRIGLAMTALLTSIWLTVIAYVLFLVAVPEES